MLPQHSTKKAHVWSIIHTKQQLNAEVTENLLFGHAIMGCDTTSRLHGLGKGMILKKLQNSEDLRNIGKLFHEGGKEQDEVIRAGEKALLLLYSNKKEETLDGLRLKKFLDKVSIKLSQVEPNSLPPTSSAAKYHSLRVYLQVQKWKKHTL